MSSSSGPGAAAEVMAPLVASQPQRHGRWTRRGVWETALLVTGLLFNFLLLPHSVSADGYKRYQALTQLLTGHGLSASQFSLIGPLFAAPLWYLTSLASLPLLGIAMYNTIIFALALVAFYWALSPLMDHHLLRVFLLLLTFASMFPYHLGQFYGEVFTAALAAVGLTLLALRRTRGALAGGALLALGVANTPASLVALALSLARHVWRTRRWRWLLIGAGAVALAMLESWARRGSPLATGYSDDHGFVSIMPFSGRPGFSYPFLLGLLSILFSFGKGLIFYVPGLFLPVRSRIAQLGDAARPLWHMYSLWLWFVVGLVLVYSPWWGWNGDWFWGPRFFLFACAPASFALALWTQRPASRLWINLVALLALALSVWVGINGPLFDQATMGACLANHLQSIAYCDYTPDFSALWRPLVNAHLYGIGPRFMAVEGLTPRTLTYGGFALAIGGYVAAPLVRAIWRQSRDLLAAWAPRLAAVWADLRF